MGKLLDPVDAYRSARATPAAGLDVPGDPAATGDAASLGSPAGDHVSSPMRPRVTPASHKAQSVAAARAARPEPSQPDPARAVRVLAPSPPRNTSHPLAETPTRLIAGPNGRMVTVRSAIVDAAARELARARVRGTLPIEMVDGRALNASQKLDQVLYEVALGVPNVLGNLHRTLWTGVLDPEEKVRWYKWVAYCLRVQGVAVAGSDSHPLRRGARVSDLEVFADVLFDVFMRVSAGYARDAAVVER